ncbi:urotensin 2 domain containing [Electrophorus electricus]|uniref:urotensin 2 domain containing n=1 Tax=Electrophorus electricus TaxID=8005 RepID=UPI0015D0867E|nr:urotensin 2 domain containing [Electrophorus electricus]
MNLRPGLLAFLLLHGILTVQCRNLIGPGNQGFQSKDDSSIQNRIIALLLHKNIISDQDDDNGLELAIRIAQLQEVEALREELNMEKQLASRPLEKETPLPSKRGEACFWKYCV